MVAIAVLLATYNGKPAPDWGERINLNALLATLSTVLRAMLVVVVSQVISQRKWEWFEAIKERPLSHLQKFDSGSRGVLGAVQLLPMVLWRDPITLTATLILITSFLVGPFVQQASRTSKCTLVAPGLRASLPFAHYVPRRSGYVIDVERDDLGVPATDLITAIISAVTAPNSVENQIRGSCSTGNCTFPNGDPIQSNFGVTSDDKSGRHSTVAMCNKCVDISSLVTRENVPYPVLSLPNNISVSRTGGDREVVRIKPNTDLSWMGDLLTPELRSFSRWAYVNASFIGLNSYANETVAATMCSLYPCVRTYTTSITNNNVSQTEVGSKVMQLDLLPNDGVTEDGGSSALDNVYKRYAAVQSPCRVEEKVYDLSINQSSQINGTDLALYDFTDYGDFDAVRSTWLNVTAPKECIYRQNPQFVVAVSRLLNHDIFNGSCVLAKTFSCRGLGRSDSDDIFLSGLGSETVLKAIYGESYDGQSNITTGFSNVTEWFDLFAEAVTKRFRSEYGSADQADIEEGDLPLDEVQGLAWHETTCVSMRGGWLVFPIILTAITGVLALWTIATNWIHRYSRPVWKDSILPLVFYGRDFVDSALDQHSFSSREQTPPDQDANPVGKKDPLEAKNMSKIGKSIAVTMPWLQSTNSGGQAPTLRKRTKWVWSQREQQKDTSDISLTHLEERVETRPGDHGDNTTSEMLASLQDEWPPGEAHADEDDQTPEEQRADQGSYSYVDSGLPQISSISPFEYTYERMRPSDDVSLHSIRIVEGAHTRDLLSVEDGERDVLRMGQ
jgi:hypothetical protein